MAGQTGSTAVEPTKDDRGENFPVASLLLAREKRGPVLAFYRFVRQADDIADSPVLSSEEKLRRLDLMESALLAGDAAEPYAAALAEIGRRFGTGPDEARLLLDAFRQDAVKNRYEDWDDLVRYCERSANPVGRFLLRLHGDTAAADAPSDALCTALQILNHLQDLVPDRQKLDRIYLPVPWMEQAGGEAAFFAQNPSPRRRAVLDAALDRVGLLVDDAEALVSNVEERRFAAQCGMTVALARRLHDKLRAADPVLGRVALGPPDFARALGIGVARAVRPGSRDVAVTRAAVGRSGSSFKLGMASLSGERRRAINAVYAYCRVIDDVADGAAPIEEKRRAIAGWRQAVDRLSERSPTAIGRELWRAYDQFGIPVPELHALLDGMETDAAPQVRIADDAALDLYCRRVAGAVGVLSIHIFGAPQATDFALSLGRTLQVVNVLRDVDEDAAIGRVYIPLSRLRGASPDMGAADLVRHPDFARACADLAEEAALGFAAAERSLAQLDRRRLKPAILMMEAYRTMFDRLRARGWSERGSRARLTKADKLRLAWLAFGGRAAPASARSAL